MPKSAELIGKAVKKWCGSNESYELLDAHIEGDSWNAGGCVALAYAVNSLVAGSSVVGIVREFAGKKFIDHVGVLFQGHVIDADGAHQSMKNWLQHWIDTEMQDDGSNLVGVVAVDTAKLDLPNTKNGTKEVADALRSLIQSSVKAAAKKPEFLSYDPNYDTVEKLLAGLKSGKLLVHARVKDGTDFRHGIYPSAGDVLRSTESYQESVDIHGRGPELTFFAEDLMWVTHGFQNFSSRKGKKNIQAIFVEKNPTIQQSLGDGRVKLADGKVVPYERSPMYDYDDPVYRSEPGGVESGDWYTNKTQDVVAVVDAKLLSAGSQTAALFDEAARRVEAASKKGTWYHGTTPQRWKKIQQDGWLRPNVADDTQAGSAIWFTTSLQEAKSYGKTVLSLDVDDDFLANYSVKLLHSITPDVAKKTGLPREVFDRMRENAHMLVRSPIPADKLCVLDSNKAQEAPK